MRRNVSCVFPREGGGAQMEKRATGPFLGTLTGNCCENMTLFPGDPRRKKTD